MEWNREAGPQESEEDHETHRQREAFSRGVFSEEESDRLSLEQRARTRAVSISKGLGAGPVLKIRQITERKQEEELSLD